MSLPVVGVSLQYLNHYAVLNVGLNLMMWGVVVSIQYNDMVT